MIPQALEALGLPVDATRLASAALLARAGSRHHFAIVDRGSIDPGGRSSEMMRHEETAQGLALRALGYLALVDSAATRGAAAALVRSRRLFASPTYPLIVALAAPTTPPSHDWYPEHTPDVTTASAYARLVVGLRPAVNIPPFGDVAPAIVDTPNEGIAHVSARVGRFGVPSVAWDRLASMSGRDEMLAHLQRAADETRVAMSDRHHWRLLQSALLPIEPETLVVGMAVHAYERQTDTRFLAPQLGDSIVNAWLQTSATLLPDTAGPAEQTDVADELEQPWREPLLALRYGQSSW